MQSRTECLAACGQGQSGRRRGVGPPWLNGRPARSDYPRVLTGSAVASRAGGFHDVRGKTAHKRQGRASAATPREATSRSTSLLGPPDDQATGLDALRRDPHKPRRERHDLRVGHGSGAESNRMGADRQRGCRLAADAPGLNPALVNVRCFRRDFCLALPCLARHAMASIGTVAIQRTKLFRVEGVSRDAIKAALYGARTPCTTPTRSKR